MEVEGSGARCTAGRDDGQDREVSCRDRHKTNLYALNLPDSPSSLDRAGNCGQWQTIAEQSGAFGLLRRRYASWPEEYMD